MALMPRLFAGSILAILLAGMGTLGYWQFVDYEVHPELATFEHASVSPSRGKPGDKVVARWGYTIGRDCPRVVELFFGGALVTSHHGSSRGTLAGVPQKRWRELTVPKLPPGAHLIRSVAEFHCNPLRSVTVVKDIRFTVFR